MRFSLKQWLVIFVIVNAANFVNLFRESKLGLQWQWHANPRKDWYSLAARPGWLRLTSVPLPQQDLNLWSVSNLLLQKLPGPSFTITTRLDGSRLREGERAGLVMMGRDYSYIGLIRSSRGLQLIRATCIDAPKQLVETEKGTPITTSSIVYLRVEVRNEATTSFSFSEDGVKFQQLGDEFIAKQGIWIGAKVGLFALSPKDSRGRGYADFEWFRFE